MSRIPHIHYTFRFGDLSTYCHDTLSSGTLSSGAKSKVVKYTNNAYGYRYKVIDLVRKKYIVDGPVMRSFTMVDRPKKLL